MEASKTLDTHGPAQGYRDLIADYLAETADFRWRIVERFPDDPRNEQSAKALEQAAQQVRELPDEEFDGFLEFQEAMRGYISDWIPAWEGRLTIDHWYSQRVTRYGFGDGSFSPLPRGMDSRPELEILLDTILDGVVEAQVTEISEAAGEVGFNQPPNHLVQLLDDWGQPIRWPEEDEDEDD